MGLKKGLTTRILLVNDFPYTWLASAFVLFWRETYWNEPMLDFGDCFLVFLFL